MLFVDGRTASTPDAGFATRFFPACARPPNISCWLRSLTDLTPGAHSFEVKARDVAGNEDPTPASRIFTVSAMSVIIDSPASGQTVTAGQLVVRGRVISDARPAGVVVNDVPASIIGSLFSAVVFVDTVTTSIKVVAQNEQGDTATTTIAVSVVANASLVTLRVAPSIGLVPVTVRFGVGGADPESVALDLDGDGSTDFVGSLVDQTFSYVTPGLYTPRVQFVQDGTNLTAETVVLVLDRTELDAVLQLRWTAMKEALRVRDIPTALLQVAQDQRSFYEAVFNNASGDLANIDALMTTFELQEVVGHDALSVMVRPAGSVLESFEIRFRIDDDGVWRLWSF